MNFKSGEKIVCVDASGQRYLKAGMVYEAATPDGEKVFVNGYRRYSFLKTRFKKLDVFDVGDAVFLKDRHFSEPWFITAILPDGSIELKTASRGFPVPIQCWGMYYGKSDGLDHATLDEVKAGKRLDGSAAE